MKTKFKRIGKQSLSIVLAVMMMVSTMLVGMVTSNAANETGYTYNQDYMYVDLSAISKVASGVNYYWDDLFTNYGGWITDKEDLGNYTYKFDFSAIGSHKYFRGFKIVWEGSAGTNIAVLENNTYNCVKVNSDYTLSWTTYTEQTTTSDTLYVKNTLGWSTVKVYIWGSSNENNNSWSGAEMTKLDGTEDVYYYKLPDSSNTSGNCIFNKGDNENQSGDLTLSNQLGKIYDNSTKTSESYTPPVATTHNVTVNYNAAHVSSITLNNTAVTSNGYQVEVENNSTPTLTVTTNDGYKITSVTQGDTTLTGSDGTYTLKAVTADTTITVTTEATTPTGDSKAFYIGGKFKTSTVDNTSKWTAHPDNLQFEYVSPNLYKIETKVNITENNNNYFYVYTKSGTYYIDYGATQNTWFNGATNLTNSISITNTGFDGHQLYLSNPSSADNAVIWLETSSYKEDGTGSLKIFYTEGMPTAQYALSGDLSGAWNTYNSDYLVNTSTGNPFVFKRQITVGSTSDTYFRLISSLSGNPQYGSSKDQEEFTPNVKKTTTSTRSNAYKIPKENAGTYMFYVDQSGETPVIWVESADYKVSAKGQYTFDGSTYNDYTSNPPTITIDHTTVTAGASVEVTATNDVPGYMFIGWASTNGTFGNASALSTTFTPNADGAVAVARYAKQLTATVKKADGSNNGTWTGVSNSYTAGDTVTITFTPAETDYVSEVTVNGESKITSLVDNTLTFTAGVSSDDLSAMEIVVTFGARPQHRFYVDYVTGCDSTMGTFTSSVTSGGTYDYNTEITLTAAPATGYTFVGWYNNINGTGDRLSTDTAYKFKLTADTEVYAKFAENTGTLIQGLYLIYSTNNNNPQTYTNYLNLYIDSSDQVYAYFDADTFDAYKDYYFMISTSTGENSYQKAYMNDNNKAFTSTDNQQYITATYQHYGLDGTNYYAGKFSVTDAGKDVVASVKINLGYYNGTNIVESSTDSTKAYTYEVIPTTSGAVVSKIKIYAKDGTLRTNYQKYADMADTVVTGDGITKLTSHTYYQEAYATVGSTITVTTTIDETYKGTYFVKAFCINGISYGIIDKSQAKTTTGVYTCTYTIPEDCTDKFIEITPIYYYIDDTNAVTFYVEGFEENVQEVWGNTIAVQAWYNNGEEKAIATSNTKNALGGYPGQPLVYEGGKYSMQIPKYLNGVTTNNVRGITLNNYIWDDIHVKNFNNQQNDNAQTYDYDDFYKLANKTDADNIIFDFRYRTETDNDPSQSGLSSSTYNKEELEPLTDYYGNIVDLFGNELSESWKTDFDSTYLTVISNGYVNNYIGKYATEWSVYDHDGKYITTINCSQLFDEETVNSVYTTAYNTLKPYANLPVKIAYEKSIFSGNDKGNRADGRWYYSTKAQKITSNVIIQYKPNDASSFIQDEFSADSNVGSVTGTKAYFTNADYYGKTSCDGEVDGGKFSVRAETDSEAKYYFIGWYLKTSDGYAFMSNDPDYDIPMTNNETYVARFIPTPSGTLTLSHTILPNSDSAIGRTYIKADIVSADGKTVLYSIPETSGNLVVPSKYVTYTSTNKIVVTLRTVPYGNDTVEDFYDSNKDPYNAGLSGKGEKTYTRERPIKDLFTEGTDSDGNKTYTLTNSNIPYYSKITPVSLNYTITYTYNTRLDGEQKYVIKDTVSGIELEEMWAANVAAGLEKEQLSKAFITKKAPFVSNFRYTITWKIDNAEINGYEATVSSTSETTNLTIQALITADSWTQPATVTYGELAKGKDGDYLYKTGTDNFPVSKTFNEKSYDFSFWAIFDNKTDAETFNNAVTAYLNGDNVTQDMSERLTAITNLEGYSSLITKSYSKEFNYICYQDYFIVPVYADEFSKSDISEAQASIRLLEYTRNQWTDTENGVNGNGVVNENGSKTDYLYTDFALSFDKDQLLIQNNKNIKVGIVLEVVDQYDNVIDLKSYTTESNTETIGTNVKAADNNGKIGSYTYGNKERNLYRYEIDNSKISVKNRIEYYLRFSNSEQSQQNVVKVYSYIIDTTGNTIHLSDPVYMNMYEIGNLTYITSDLASIDLGSAQ